MLVSAAFQALFEKLTSGASTADRKAAAQDVVEQMKAGGAASFAVSLLSAVVAGPTTVQALPYDSAVSDLNSLRPILLCCFTGWWHC